MALKIHVYTISKNEEKHCKRWVKSCEGSDGLYVVDTGSSDSTVEILRSLGAHVVRRTFNPWRFDDARNYSLSLLPDDCDVAVILDMDEILCDGWRKIIEDAWVSRPDVTELRHLYAWSPQHVFQNSRVHARHGYKWIKPIHEVQIHIEGKPIAAYIQNTLVIHLPDNTKSRGQYLDLLRISTKESPHDARNSIYYARELNFNKRWEAVVKEATRYLSLPEASWSHERAFAYRLIARSQQALDQLGSAEKSLLRSCAEEPNSRESWYCLGDLYRVQSRFSQGYSCALRALSITPKPQLYLDDPSVWSYAAHDLAAVCAFYSGYKVEAVKHAVTALAANPSDARLMANLKSMV